MLKVYVNNIELFVKPNSTVLEACEIIGIEIPRFCYHETLSIAGNIVFNDLMLFKFLPKIFIVSLFFSLFTQVFSLMWRFLFNSTLINKKKIKIKPKKFRFKLKSIRKT